MHAISATQLILSMFVHNLFFSQIFNHLAFLGTYLFTLTFRYQFVPQMIFLNSLFGYLAILIIMKWCTGSQADLYHVMIYMFLSPFEDLGENQLFRGQSVLQA